MLARSSSRALSQSFFGGSPTNIYYSKKGTFIPTSLLEDLVGFLERGSAAGIRFYRGLWNDSFARNRKLHFRAGGVGGTE